jgi:hypothetical protein
LKPLSRTVKPEDYSEQTLDNSTIKYILPDEVQSWEDFVLKTFSALDAQFKGHEESKIDYNWGDFHQSSNLRELIGQVFLYLCVNNLKHGAISSFEEPQFLVPFATNQV